MIRNSFPLIYLSTLLTIPLSAEEAKEYSVIEKPFKKVTTLNGVFLPTDSTAISIKPDVWTDFTVTSYLSQGSVVKKGEPLIQIDTTKIDEYISKTEKARQIELLKLAETKHELAQLEINTPINLNRYAREEKEAQDDLKWFTEIGMPLEIESTKRRVKDAERSLSYQLEELKQLEKMYSEDNKTEETEEIILTRTRNSVDRARFSLKSTQISSEQTLKTHIPRKLKSYKQTAEKSIIANKSAKEKLKRALEIKRLEVAKAEKADAEKAKDLAQAKADRKMMNIVAPADGVVYYGSIKNGRWNPANALKVLKVGAKLPANMTLMTFIPAKSDLYLSAFVPENQLGAIKQGDKGLANTQLNNYQNFPVSINNLASYPQADGTFNVSIKSDKTPTNVVPGMKSSIYFTTHQLEEAIVIPSGFLTLADDGTYTVKLKLAAGKTEERPVEISVSNDKSAVVSKGLEDGHVIVK